MAQARPYPIHVLIIEPPSHPLWGLLHYLFFSFRESVDRGLLPGKKGVPASVHFRPNTLTNSRGEDCDVLAREKVIAMLLCRR